MRIWLFEEGEGIEAGEPAAAPIIGEVAWAIDLCNEPEAVAGKRWIKVEPSLAILRDGARSLLPSSPISIGSSPRSGMHDRLALDLDFRDYHVYAPLGEPAECPPTPAVLGELGCTIPERDRGSREVWRVAQEHLAALLNQISPFGYEAAFLWYLTDLDAADAMSLVYRGEAAGLLQTSFPLT